VSGDDFIKNAEIALDAATAAPVGVFDPSMRERARSRIAIEADLRRAIGSEELVAYYQPIVHAASGRVQGFEALVRWKKPDGSLIPPVAFISIAEESGLIRALDFCVLESACRFVRRIREQTGSSDLFVNVNLSAAHFADGTLPRLVKDVLDAAGVPGSALKLEVTETALIENAEVAAAAMRALAEHGVRFGLDDFGTGYSSLSYLHRFPFETLKIDRSFIRTLGSEQGRPELAEAIVLLARALGLTVVAEGVETQSQLEFLKSRRCDYVQGFLFSPAVPDPEAEGLIRAQPYLCAAPSAAAE
jgi:EAL domain-containing protein (putative c-di-GMP-specific phosphodiesterase class I)